MVAAMTGPRAGRAEAVAGEWKCPRCGRYLGRVVGTVFIEPNGDKSQMPVVRHCPKCKRRNVKVQ